MALLIAVFTALLFSPGHLCGRTDKPSDDYVIAGSQDVPIASRQETPQHSARRDGDDPVELSLSTFESVAAHAFATWPLLTSSTSPRAREAGSRRARGPPAC
ncbi:hypothetical protein [Nannocystis exedens]|uniref:hypothetical protein n=1 Tax=Nannocystis exedens TaxID=54 RepID=UPI000BBA0957|nr:hypothetical protein [Nannocystis exedens]